ncbi:uncharacterized protein A4U43_C09F1970 [Asparagus officinalis]|uniref:succinate dehydrogenase n=1 Tax=Asparagus officinalis TaxID=4686 RepID=A0A5P1E4K2_ASPOF|nr:uncharacterized protein A4U43_C09F1970 [Asparagus officinalis]
MVLDALIKIKNEADPGPHLPPLLPRGHLRLLRHEHPTATTAPPPCLTKIKADSPAASTIAPLPHMYVVKDLVVDMTNFYNQYKSVEPWLKRKEPAEGGKEVLQSKKDRAKLDGMYECILCACCSTSCPSYWWNPESYLGPAALLHANSGYIRVLNILEAFASEFVVIVLGSDAGIWSVLGGDMI